jgi:hypothetical protein
LTGDYQRIGDVVLRNFDAVTTDYYLKVSILTPNVPKS